MSAGSCHPDWWSRARARTARADIAGGRGRFGRRIEPPWRGRPMNAVITKNTRQGHTPEPPRHANGDLYLYAMYFDGDERIAYADTLEDLLDVLMHGYAAMDEQECLAARIRLAVRA